jgi:hypothetical protein
VCSDSFGCGWVGCWKDDSFELLVKYMFGCQRLGIGEGFEMNDSPIHIVLVQWVVGFVLCRCRFGVAEC